MTNREKMYELLEQELTKGKFVSLGKILDQFGINIMEEITLLLSETEVLENRYNIAQYSRALVLKQLFVKTKVLAGLMKIVKEKANNLDEKYTEIRDNNINMRFYNTEKFIELLLKFSNQEDKAYGMKKIVLSQFGSISGNHGDREQGNILGNLTVVAPVKCISELFQDDKQSTADASSKLGTLAQQKESFAFIWNHFYDCSVRRYIECLTLDFANGEEEIQFVIQNNSSMVVALKQILLYSKKYGTDFEGISVDLIGQEHVKPKQKILTCNRGPYNNVIAGIK